MIFESFLFRLLGNFFSIMLISYGFSGITVASVRDGILAAIILGLINAFIKPAVFLITLPINILSLGLFTLLINAFMLKVVDWMIPGFSVEGFLTALFGALTVSVVSTVITYIATRYQDVRTYRW
ncbi:MAG: phage holin family protein [Deltaproteobacteria bacterium]|nr:phage holin family protein [Deltaproteobacteria bacterium]NIS76842.1 phage holin family protein [Deltaproteobacteria bacterium]